HKMNKLEKDHEKSSEVRDNNAYGDDGFKEAEVDLQAELVLQRRKNLNLKSEIKDLEEEVSCMANEMKTLKKVLELAASKLKTFEKFDKSSMALDGILSRQKSSCDKTGLGFIRDQKKIYENDNVGPSTHEIMKDVFKSNKRSNPIRKPNAMSKILSLRVIQTSKKFETPRQGKSVREESQDKKVNEKDEPMMRQAEIHLQKEEPKTVKKLDHEESVDEVHQEYMLSAHIENETDGNIKPECQEALRGKHADSFLLAIGSYISYVLRSVIERSGSDSKVDVVEQTIIVHILQYKYDGGLYSGGSAQMVEKALDIHGDEILYVGDHIYTDVSQSKVHFRWRTALICRELEEEFTALACGKDHREKLIRLMNQKEVVGDVFNQLRLALQRRTRGRAAQIRSATEMNDRELTENMQKLLIVMEELDKRIAPMLEADGEHFNKRWGYLSRAGLWDKSHLTRQIEKYADIYTSRVSNFLRYTPFMYFRSQAQ
ncbi:hypothetical protein KI387_026894, partial [Taxus chinensis]